MNCPVDGNELKISERQGVEIDYCPQCRGVWLDRGELDKIIERSGSISESRRDEDEGYVPFGGRLGKPDRDEYSEDRRKDAYYDERRKHEDPNYYKRRKRKSFLEDLFDFD
jgi:Zn-finger nucleic acid-binding protein